MTGKLTDLVLSSDGGATPSIDELVSGLECRIGRAHIALPVDAVARIVEYRPVSLPLAKKWVGGVAMLDGVPLLSIALVPPREPQARGRVSGIVLQRPASTAPQLTIALEIEEIFVFVRARRSDRRAPPGTKVPRWISSAVTTDGRQIGWIDVGTMLGDLAQSMEGGR